MKYKVRKQCEYDERRFDLENIYGEVYSVDIYTDGELNPPQECLEDNEKFGAWLKSFIGKELEIEKITPYAYFTSGSIKIIN